MSKKFKKFLFKKKIKKKRYNNFINIIIKKKTPARFISNLQVKYTKSLIIIIKLHDLFKNLIVKQDKN
jgi:hypothetical protein